MVCLPLPVLLTVFCYMGYMRQSAETVFAVFPCSLWASPMLGNYVDHKGKAASMLMIGSMLLVLAILLSRLFFLSSGDNAVGGVVIAYLTILVLGASFHRFLLLYGPVFPKLVDAKIIGSAYAYFLGSEYWSLAFRFLSERYSIKPIRSLLLI